MRPAGARDRALRRSTLDQDVSQLRQQAFGLADDDRGPNRRDSGAGFRETPGPPAMSSGYCPSARSAASGGTPAWRSIATMLKASISKEIVNAQTAKIADGRL